jgi:hypothetical protein
MNMSQTTNLVIQEHQENHFHPKKNIRKFLILNAQNIFIHTRRPGKPFGPGAPFNPGNPGDPDNHHNIHIKLPNVTINELTR